MEIRRAYVALEMLLAGLMLAGRPCALALNPALDISQYGHRSWKISDGFAKGPIYSIAQTPDGFLWLGTEFGVLRFDGIRNTSWPHDRELPSARIFRLLTTRDGTLWIGTMNGLASWKGEKLTIYPELAGQSVSALLEDDEGAVWAGGSRPPIGRLCAIQKGTVQCYGEDGSFGSFVFSLCESRGHVWAAANNGLWRWRPGPSKLYPLPSPTTQITDLIEGDNGAVWAAMRRRGIVQFFDGKAEVNPLPASGAFDARTLLRDREGGLWIGTPR